MKDNNNIEDWYKKELENYQVTPNDKGWETIADKLDKSDSPPSLTEKNIESWYKSEIKNAEATPDQEVWNKLSTNLDVQNVWTRIFNSLNRYDRMIWWRNFSLRTAAVLILLFGSYLTYESIGSSQLANRKSQIVNLNSKISNKNTPLTLSRGEVNAQNQSQIPNRKSQIPNLKSQISNPKSQTVNLKSQISNRKSQTIEPPFYASLIIDKFSPKKAGSLEIVRQESTINTFEQQGVDLNTKTLELKEFLVKKEKNKIIFNDKRFSSHFVFGMYARRIYVGINGGFKNQNLITKLKSSLHLKEQQRLDFGYNFGGTIGIILSDKLNLESNVNFISTSGYNRRYESNDLVYNQNLNLNYTTISVLAKRMNNKSTFDNKKYSTNLIGGIYAGYLTSAKISSGNNTYDVNNEFNSLDLGVVLGIEQDRYLTKQIIITPGIRYHQGLLNIANGSNPYEAARTFSFEFNVGVKYIFLKKN